MMPSSTALLHCQYVVHTHPECVDSISAAWYTAILLVLWSTTCLDFCPCLSTSMRHTTSCPKYQYCCRGELSLYRNIARKRPPPRERPGALFLAKRRKFLTKRTPPVKTKMRKTPWPLTHPPPSYDSFRGNVPGPCHQVILVWEMQLFRSRQRRA